MCFWSLIKMTIFQRLNLSLPIFLAPMAGVTTPKLAAEVSNAGGLGALGLGASNVASCREQIRATQALTDQPFQVNFFCHQSEEIKPEQHQTWIDYIQPEFAKFNATVPTELKCIYPSFLDNDDLLNVVLETGVKVVSFHFGIPHAHQIQALKQAGVVTLATATNLLEAQKIEQAGIDMVVAQGIEAGGHRGIFNAKQDSALTTAELVKLLKQHISVPIVAAGAIMTGQDIRQMLDLGATACQLGTAFIQCESSNANAHYRQALFSQPITQITEVISGRPARGIVNQWHLLDDSERPVVADYPYTYDLAKQLNDIASKQGNYQYAAFWAGTGVGRIREMSAPELVKTLAEEMQ